MSSVQVACFVLDATPGAVRAARRRIGAAVEDCDRPFDQDFQESIELVAAELLTNAARHVGGLLTVGLYRSGERLLLEVFDGSSSPPVRRKATDEDEGGRGLALVEALSVRSGWAPSARGKRCWAELELPAPASCSPQQRNVSAGMLT